jgi:hypothetical protein
MAQHTIKYFQFLSRFQKVPRNQIPLSRWPPHSPPLPTTPTSPTPNPGFLSARNTPPNRSPIHYARVYPHGITYQFHRSLLGLHARAFHIFPPPYRIPYPDLALRRFKSLRTNHYHPRSLRLMVSRRNIYPTIFT